MLYLTCSCEGSVLLVAEPVIRLHIQLSVPLLVDPTGTMRILATRHHSPSQEVSLVAVQTEL